ncbi:hypothetical protein QP948_05850 [Corynebacterium bovis]|nr:hypothetical protein [Corynebacterium bovis]MDK8510929.1 hypothetical protein [Corynebacterium bovis]
MTGTLGRVLDAEVINSGRCSNVIVHRVLVGAGLQVLHAPPGAAWWV